MEVAEFWVADSKHRYKAIPINLQSPSSDMSAIHTDPPLLSVRSPPPAYSSNGSNSSQPPLDTDDNVGRKQVANHLSSLWLPHSIAFCRQSIGRRLCESRPGLHIQACPGAEWELWKLYWVHTESKAHGSSSSSSHTSEEIISLPSVSWDEIKLVPDKVHEQTSLPRWLCCGRQWSD